MTWAMCGNLYYVGHPIENRGLTQSTLIELVLDLRNILPLGGIKALSPTYKVLRNKPGTLTSSDQKSLICTDDPPPSLPLLNDIVYQCDQKLQFVAHTLC